MAEKGDYYNTMESRFEEKGTFKEFVYNPRTGQVLGRTCASWCKITVFYIIFYACLTAFWTVMLIIFYQTLDTHEPKWKLDSSKIGNIPGIGFRPRPPDDTIDSTLIWFKHGGNSGNWKYWVKDLDDYLDAYQEQNRKKYDYAIDCERDDKLPTKRVCLFDITKLGDKCTQREKYGYFDGQPCVLIKLNRIFGWAPEPYTHEAMVKKGVPKSVMDVYDNSSIYITCEGENAADRENMGKLDFYPDEKIKSHFFPFTNLQGYESPFVFVRFGEIKKGVLVNVECKAWAANINQDRMERRGSVHFEVLVD